MSDFFSTDNTRAKGSQLESKKLQERARLAAMAMEGKLDAYISGGGFGIPHPQDLPYASAAFEDAANEFAKQNTIGGNPSRSRTNLRMGEEEKKAYRLAASAALDYLSGNSEAFRVKPGTIDSLMSGIPGR